MSTQVKLLKRVFGRPPRADIKQSELEKALKTLGFAEIKTGKSSGSRVRFALISNRAIQVRIHRSHGGNPVDKGALESVICTVENSGLFP